MAKEARYSGQRLVEPGHLALGGPSKSVAEDALFGPSGPVQPTGIATGEAFGTAKLTYVVQPTGIESGEAFGTPSLPTVVKPTGIESGEAFGTPYVVRVISPTGITTGEAFGTPTVTGGILTVQPSGIASGEAFGGANVVQIVQPTGIASGEAVGSPTVAQVIRPTGIASAEAVGSPTVVQTAVIKPPSIPSGGAFGTALVSRSGLGVRPLPIDSAEAFGIPTVTLAGPTTIQPVGITSGLAFGGPLVSSPSILPPPPGTAPGTVVAPPRNQLYDPTTGFRYFWDINHSAEDPLTVTRNAERAAPNASVRLVRQQSHGGPLLLRLTGYILDPAQQAQFEDFMERCETRKLHFHDSGGDTYEVIITTFDSKKKWGVNPRNTLIWYWQYTLEMEVMDTLSGALAEVVA